MALIESLQAYPLLFYGYIFVVGLLVGSFLNVVIYRLPIVMEREFIGECRLALAEYDEKHKTGGDSGEHKPSPNKASEADEKPFNLMVPRSHCPACKAPIKAWQNIPVISYLLQKGKCVNCHAKISPRYPIIELCTALISLFVAVHFGVSAACLGALLLSWALIALSIIDYDEYLLPDDITLLFLWIGLLFAVYGVFVPLQAAVIGAIAGYMSLWIVNTVFSYVAKKNGMGNGDFKLLAMLGAWMGWKVLPVIVILSSFVGAMIGISLILFAGRDREKQIPFGPYLAISGWLCLFWGDDILNYYLSTLH